MPSTKFRPGSRSGKAFYFIAFYAERGCRQVTVTASIEVRKSAGQDRDSCFKKEAGTIVSTLVENFSEREGRYVLDSPGRKGVGKVKRRLEVMDERK